MLSAPEEAGRRILVPVGARLQYRSIGRRYSIGDILSMRVSFHHTVNFVLVVCGMISETMPYLDSPPTTFLAGFDSVFPTGLFTCAVAIPEVC